MADKKRISKFCLKLFSGKHTQKKAYLPVVVSARPSGTAAGAMPCVTAGGTVEVVSAFAMVTSLALLASSPQWGQKLWPSSTEAQARWKRWEMLTSGWHSMNVPCTTNNIRPTYWSSAAFVSNKTPGCLLPWGSYFSLCIFRYRGLSNGNSDSHCALPHG